MGKVDNIFVERLLKDIKENNTLPWERTYEVFYKSFNYTTKVEYSGINRVLLPPGEYMTANQINSINKESGTNYRFAKGIVWLPVLFYKDIIKELTPDEEKKFGEDLRNGAVLKGSNGYTYYMNKEDKKLYKAMSVSRYSLVAERSYFQDADGNCPRSRYGDFHHDTIQSAEEVIAGYLENSGVNVINSTGYASYCPTSDTLSINPLVKSSQEYYSMVFHEIAHSAVNRLNPNFWGKTLNEKYAEEECVAEIASALVCQELGISVNSSEKNSINYISSWYKRIEDYGNEIIYLISVADRVSRYILDVSKGTITQKE